MVWDDIILLSFFGFVICLILGVVHKIRRKSFKPYTLPTLIFFVVMFLTAQFAPIDDSDKADKKTTHHQSTATSKTVKKEVKKKKPEKIYYINLTSKTYNKSTDTLTLKGNTNLPDGTDVFFALKRDNSLKGDYATVPDDTKIKDGKFTVTLGDYEDPDDGDEYIQNGSYQVVASLSYEGNEKIFGNYEEIKDKIAFKNGKIEESIDNGWDVENIDLGKLVIKNAYTADQIKQLKAEQKLKKAKTIDYNHLKKNPDKYAGEYVKYTGQILQILEEGGQTVARIAVTKDEFGDWDFNDVIWVDYDGTTDYVEDDVVTFWGEVLGTKTYTSQTGWEISVPEVKADGFKKN